MSASGIQIEYPSSDGKKIADNTLPSQWITTIKCNVEAIHDARPAVIVASDLL